MQRYFVPLLFDQSQVPSLCCRRNPGRYSRFQKNRREETMSIVDFMAALQTSGAETHSSSSNPPAAGYFVIGMIAFVLALTVWVFVRTRGAGRS